MSYFDIQNVTRIDLFKKIIFKTQTKHDVFENNGKK